VARELPFARSFSNVLRSRYGASVYGHLRNILDAVIPVQVVGHNDYSDIERPCWGIASQHVLHINRYTTSSITSAVDIAIEAIGFEMLNATAGAIQTGPALVLTPPSSWVPWANTPGIGALSFTPGILPQVDFDPGRTIAIAGNVTAAPPYWGAEIYNDIAVGHLAWVEFPALVFKEYNYYQCDNWHYFRPPLILPSPLFLTVCTPTKNTDLWVSWRYREIG
jgi:hypothetical protein